MAGIMQKHFFNQLYFGIFRTIKRPVRNHKTSMFLTLLKLRKEKKKGGGRRRWDYLNHILQTTASLPVWRRRCQVATRRTFLWAELLTFANSCPQWNDCLGPGPWTRGGIAAMPTKGRAFRLHSRIESVLWPHMLTGTAKNPLFFHSLKTWKFGELARAAHWTTS